MRGLVSEVGLQQGDLYVIGDPCCPGLLTAEPGAALTHDSVLQGPGSVLMGERDLKLQLVRLSTIQSLGPQSWVPGMPQAGPLCPSPVDSSS